MATMKRYYNFLQKFLKGTHVAASPVITADKIFPAPPITSASSNLARSLTPLNRVATESPVETVWLTVLELFYIEVHDNIWEQDAKKAKKIRMG